MKGIDSAAAETFSPNSGLLAIEDLFTALPKTRQMSNFGAYNEAVVVVEKLIAITEIKDRNKSL